MSRRDSRKYAMEVVYQKELGTYGELTILDEDKIKEDDRQFADNLMGKLQENKEVYIEKIEQSLKDWKFDRLGYLEKSILLLSFTEMEHFPEIPLKVSLDEWIQITKNFCGEEAKKLVNGVLNEYKNVLIKEGKRLE